MKKIIASTCICHDGSYLFGIVEDRSGIYLKDLKSQMGFEMNPKYAVSDRDCFLDLDEKWQEDHGKIQKIYASGDLIFACCQKGEQGDLQQRISLIKWNYETKAIIGYIPLPTLDISIVDKHIVVRSSPTQIELIPFDLDIAKKIIIAQESFKGREINILKVEGDAIYFAILKGNFKNEGVLCYNKKPKKFSTVYRSTNDRWANRTLVGDEYIFVPIPRHNQIKVFYKENRKLKITLSVPDLDKHLVHSDLLNLGNYLLIYTNRYFSRYLFNHNDLLGVWDIEYGQKFFETVNSFAGSMYYRYQIKQVLTALRSDGSDPTGLEKELKKIYECIII